MWFEKYENKENLTIIEARQALVDCFTIEPCHIIGQTTGKEINKSIENLLRQTFKKVGGNYDKPTKEDIIKVMDELKIIAKQFTDQDVIENNYKLMLGILNKVV